MTETTAPIGRPAPASAEGLVDPTRHRPGRGAFLRLVGHLAHREISSLHRNTTLGWAWPVTRQLAQLAVLVFVFSRLVNLNIKDFPVFVFSGLLAWTWFAAAMIGASSSLLNQRHLLFLPRFPAAAVPVVTVAVPFVDVLMALPILLVMLGFGSGVPTRALLLPAPIVVQLVLMCGVAWLIAPLAVHFRDVPNIVGVGTLLLFYLTPVFYSTGSVPGQYAWLLRLNPMTTLIETYRAILLGQPWPGTGHLIGVAVLSVVLAVAGIVVFKRVEDGLTDQL